MKGLIMHQEWLDLILSGQKTLEMRNRNTACIGEKIYLLETKTKRIRGTCVIQGVQKMFDTKSENPDTKELEKYTELWEKLRPQHCIACSYRMLRKYYRNRAKNPSRHARPWDG